jgi:hypothetical protein
VSEQVAQDVDRSEQAGIAGAIRDLEVEAGQAEDLKGGAEPVAGE